MGRCRCAAVAAARSPCCPAGNLLSRSLGRRGRQRAWRPVRDGQVAHLLRAQGAEASTRGTGARAMSDSSCRTYRELIGVYIVGAIEPAERSLLDAHLGKCSECRAELAGLALLPAMMHRVPVEEAERLHEANPAGAGPVTPSPDLLDTLLRRVSARKRTRRLRSAFAVAAAILIAAGSGAGVAAQTLAPAPAPGPPSDEATRRKGRRGAAGPQ